MDTSQMAQALGQKGGQATSKRYGTDHFKRMAQLSAEARRAKKRLKIAS